MYVRVCLGDYDLWVQQQIEVGGSKYKLINVKLILVKYRWYLVSELPQFPPIFLRGLSIWDWAPVSALVTVLKVIGSIKSARTSLNSRPNKLTQRIVREASKRMGLLYPSSHNIQKNLNGCQITKKRKQGGGILILVKRA